MSKQEENNSKACAPVKREKDILQHMIDSAKNIHLVYLDRDFNFVRVNQAYADTCGYKPEEMIGKNHFALYPHEENEAIFKRVRDTGVPAQFHDKPFIFPDQPARAVTYWDWTLEPVKDNSGKVIELIFSLVETTERKKAEDTLAKKQDELQTIIDSSQGWIFYTDCKGQLIWVNNAFAKVMGLPKDQLEGKSIFELYPKEEAEAFWNDDKQVITSGKAKVGIVEKMRSAKGQRWVQTDKIPYRDNEGNIIGVIGFSVDVTEHKKVEEELKGSEERLKRSQEIAHLGSWELDLLKDKLTWSDEVYRIFGLTPQEFGATYEAFLSYVHPDDRAAVDCAYSGSVIEGRDSYQIDHRVIRKDTGEVRFVHEKCIHTRDNTGKIIRSLGMVHDITERKKIEENLKNAKEQYALLFNSVSEGFANYRAIYDENGRLNDLVVLEINPAGAKYSGVTREQQLGKTWRQVWVGIDDSVFDLYRQIDKTGNAYNFEHFSDITNRWYDVKIYKISKDQFAATFTDITERKQLQQKIEEYTKNLENLVEQRTKQLKDSERLAAIGATAGMVGHDIRNPLQAMISDVYLMKDEIACAPECKTKEGLLESLVSLEENITYINKIVQDLQDYARPIAPAAQEVNLTTLCDAVLFKNGIPKNVAVACEIEPEAKFITSDNDLLKRILSNLANNAVQAMPEGGKLTIHACKVQNDVVITVKDTGVGIPEEVRSKLFTPMFTTKSKGQGFGLAVVKRLTEALGGTVTFESKVGTGTKFIIRLPPQELNGK
jgi:PAS domain S-box-containing protein